ncbi:hypothetical protein GGS24DRAFT_66994 [Hypoxylon argillaceum]|nr:hypothetical protein GGS24DRAFT_66994 [Hypoxylon argillaceum]
MQRRILSRLPPVLSSLAPKTPTPTNPKAPAAALARRLLSRHAQLASRTRPQLPFLSTPLARSNQFRYLTTERKQWLVQEVYRGFKYTAYLWAILGCSVVAYGSVQQEWLERKYPTPHEWGFVTRLRFRFAKWGPDRTDWPETDWVVIGEYAANVIARLEDKAIEGAGLEPLTEGGVWIDGVGESGYDVTAKSEPWRRGYYEALMLGAKAAEQLDDHVVDTTRHLVFPASTVIGPSNPHPRPIPFGAEKAPLEENCERAYAEPETFYMRILTTRGFSSKQKMDAALGYASWLDFKNIPDAAARMYEWALSLASENVVPAEIPYDRHSYVLQDNARAPSTNILTALTAFAAHKARNNDIPNALPILLSVLRARRSLPEPNQNTATPNPFQPSVPSDSPWAFGNIRGTISRLAAPPAYPAAPDDGESPPSRDARERCEEAALNLYIGEIIFAGRAREDGLAWTREAVDLAEEQLHRPDLADAAAKQTCKECLASGLENWGKMVARLAREEREREAQGAAGTGSWFAGLWGEGPRDEVVAGRWAAEEGVVKERTRRAQERLEELETPSSPFSSIFTA